MREILFRGKSIYSGEWVEGSLLIFPNTGRTKILKWNNADLDFDQVEVDSKSISQYTGLTDKNGKKIFERDIVKIEHKHYEVKYILGQFFIGVNMPIAYKRFECEVIGNIHDNPELIRT